MLEFAYLNSHYQSGLKNLLDVAVLQHIEIGKNLHLRHQYEKIDEIPFDFVAAAHFGGSVARERHRTS